MMILRCPHYVVLANSLQTPDCVFPITLSMCPLPQTANFDRLSCKHFFYTFWLIEYIKLSS